MQSLIDRVENKYWDLLNPSGKIGILIDDERNNMFIATNGNLVFKVDEAWEKQGYQKFFCYTENGNPKVTPVN